MRKLVFAISAILIGTAVASAQQAPRVYKWEDKDGNVYFSDSVPPEYADQPKERVDDHGISREHIAGKKTEEELAAEKRAEELAKIAEAQRRSDLALLGVYQNVQEIERHRDRRVELFQAQSRVTELYLKNQRRELDKLRREAGKYKPYSADPGAPMIDQSLVQDIDETEALIERHENNLLEYQKKEREIIDEFNGDIERFKELKGITLTAAQ